MRNGGPVLILLSFLLIFTACEKRISSNDIPADQILRSYYASCTNNGTTYVTAEFYTAGGLSIKPFKEPYGRHVTLDAPSKILFNNSQMQVDEGLFGDVTYKARVEGWPENFRWEVD